MVTFFNLVECHFPDFHWWAGGMTVFDAEVLVHDPPFVITSPNVDWVPLFDFESRPLRARQDGRFGLEDPFQHPQVLSIKHTWSPCILRKPLRDADLDKHPMRALWWTPMQADYRLEQGSCVGNLGRLKSNALDPLCKLEKDVLIRLHTFQELPHGGNKVANTYGTVIRSTLVRLQECPMSFRDVVGQVAEFQRLLLDLIAILDFLCVYEPRLSIPVSKFQAPDRAPNMCLTASNIMGCFTNDPEAANKCLLALIPVWLIRDEAAVPNTTKIKQVDCYRVPSERIVVEDWKDEVSGVLQPFPTLHEGCSGVARHLAVRRMGSAFADLPVIEKPQVVPIPSQALPDPLYLDNWPDVEQPDIEQPTFEQSDLEQPTFKPPDVEQSTFEEPQVPSSVGKATSVTKSLNLSRAPPCKDFFDSYV